MSSHRCFRPKYLYWQGRFQEEFEIVVNALGKIESVQPISTSARAEAVLVLPHEAIIPGLCNSHSHAFQRLLRGFTQNQVQREEERNFWTWRKFMYRWVEGLSPEDVYTASAFAFMEMLASGITSVGEFHYVHHQSGGQPYTNANELSLQVLQAAKDTGIRLVLLEGIYARAGFEQSLEPAQKRFCDPKIEDYFARLEDLKTNLFETATLGLAPHSLRAVPKDWLQEVRNFNQKYRLPVHMHLHEQPRELAESLQEYGKSPMAVVNDCNLLQEDFTAIHAIHTDQTDRQILAKSKASVCACPTTERDLGDGILDAKTLADLGIPLCLGTDSQVLINLWEDARELEYHLRLQRFERAILSKNLSQGLFRAITENGARALHLPCGELQKGNHADFVSVNLNHLSLVGANPETLLTQMIFSMDPSAVKRVFVAGKPVVEDGAHKLQERLSKQFSALQAKISQGFG